MPAHCVAVNCRNGLRSAAEDAQGRAITLHIFPKDPECRLQWTLAVRRKGPGGVLWKPSRFSRLCSAHFTEDCFDRTGQTVRIHKGVIPTLFNFRKRLKRRALKPKAAPNPNPAAGDSQEEDGPGGTAEEMTASRRKIKECVDKEHNYYCSSSAKALKLALDKYLQTEDKLVKRLRNVKQRECRLRDRVSWLLMELEKKQLREESVHVCQLHSETGLGRICELHPGQTLGHGRAPALLYSEQGIDITIENDAQPSENSPNPSAESEGRSCKYIKQLRTHMEQSVCTCQEFGRTCTEESALIDNQRPHAEEWTPRERLHTYLDSNSLRQSVFATRNSLKCVRDKSFQCVVCGKSFIFLKGLRAHQQNLACRQKKKPEADTDPNDKSYQCSECGKSFSKVTYVNRHMKVHTGEKPHTCPTCGKTFSQAAHRIQHEKTHTREKNCTCSECGKSYRNTSDLNRHSLTHSDDKPYRCGECGKSFRLSDYLKVHQKIHTGETRCICSECGKCFSRVSYLKTHNRIHTGEKPYTCSECGKSFIDTLRLSRHQLTHRGKKPFQCTECGKNFRSKISLSRHEGTHNGMNMDEERTLEIATNIKAEVLETARWKTEGLK